MERAGAATRFDPENGQVYSEKELTFANVSSTAWKDRQAGYRGITARDSSVSGNVPSLKLLALRAFLDNIHCLDVGSLAYPDTPYELIKPLWRRVNRLGRGNFHAWKCFASAYASFKCANCPNCTDKRDCPKHPRWLEHHDIIYKKPPPMPTLSRMLQTTTFDHLFILKIMPTRDVNFTEIGSLLGLGVLHVEYSPEWNPMHDQQVKTWSMAAKDGLFSKLKQIRAPAQALTIDSVKHLTRFPVLESFVLESCLHNPKYWKRQPVSDANGKRPFYATKARNSKQLLTEYRTAKYLTSARYEKMLIDAVLLNASSTQNWENFGSGNYDTPSVRIILNQGSSTSNKCIQWTETREKTWTDETVHFLRHPDAPSPEPGSMLEEKVQGQSENDVTQSHSQLRRKRRTLSVRPSKLRKVEDLLELLEG